MNNFIQIKMDDKEVFKVLNETIKDIADTKEANKIISRAMLSFVKDTFATEGENIGEPWEEWSDMWVEIRNELGYTDGKKLKMQGYLYASLQRKFNIDEAIVGVGGVAEDYAAIHNFGGKAGRNKNVEIPARPYLVWSEQLKDFVLGELKYQILTKKYPGVK